MIGRLRGGGFQLDIIGNARRWFLISAAILVLSIGSLAIRKVNAGLEFRGGSAFQVQARSASVGVQDVKRAMARAGFEIATVQQVGDRGFLVQTEHLAAAERTKAVRALAEVTGADETDVNVTDVGPKWGAQITNKAIRGLIIFLIVVVIYLSIRLEPKMAGAAFVALVHDVVATAGIYSLVGIEVTPATVIAILTILGYSLYDTVVIFDRVKEKTAQLSAAGRVTYSEAANRALNEVLVRSLNTSIVSLLPVGSLLFVGSLLLGAQTLEELALALFVGISLGAYSSVFVATPVLAIWKEREQRWATLRTRISARSEAPVAAQSVPLAAAPLPEPPRAGGGVVTQAPPAAPPTGGSATTRSGAHGRTGGGGGKRKKKRKRRKR